MKQALGLIAAIGVVGVLGCSSTRHHTRVSYAEPVYTTPTTYTYTGTDSTYTDTTPAYDRDSVVTETRAFEPTRPTSTTKTTTVATTAPPVGAMRTVSMPMGSVRHDITLDEFRTHLKSGTAVIVDARAPKDFRKGHVTGAINLPSGEETAYFAKFQKDASPDQLVIVYCGGPDCPAGDNVATFLTSHGYTNVRVYTPGWQELSKSDLAP